MVSALLMFLAPASASGQEPATESELRAYLDSTRRRIAEAGRPRSLRERLAVEAAAALDRAARSSTSPEARRSYWREASDFLDQYRRDHDDPERAGEFALRASNYRWAIAWSLLREAEADPADTAIRERAVNATDDVTTRLRSLDDPTKTDASLITEIRYRLANALSERARIEPEASPKRLGIESKAAELLDSTEFPIALRGHAVVLRAELRNRRSEFKEAIEQLDSAIEAKVPLPEPERTRVLAVARAGSGQLDEAIELIRKSAIAPIERDMITFEVQLAAWKEMEPGTRRTELAATLFQSAAAFHDAEARMARIALARRFDAPDPGSPPESFESLAEGQMILGQEARAAETWIAGAERADALDQPLRAAGLRYRAAASLGRLGRWDQALAQLDRIIATPKANPVKPRARLLRALALGKAGHEARADAALRNLIGDFPRDPVADEARWIIGLKSMEAGDSEAALAFWDPIALDSPRWLDSRLAVFQAQLAVIEGPGDADRDSESWAFAPALTYLNAARQAARTTAQKLAIEFARLRLELSPRRPRPAAVDAAFEKLRAMPLNQGDRDQLEALQLIRLARDARYTDAERQLRSWAARANTRGLDLLADWLDVEAELSESDLTRRRLGDLAVTLLQNRKSVSPGGQELDRLRLIRAVANQGDLPEARKRLLDLKSAPSSATTAVLALLARTQVLLGLDADAITTFERIVERAQRGTRPWLLYRSEIAAAHLRLGRPQRARQVLQTTRLLFPDIARTDLAKRYETLEKQARDRP